MEPPRPAQGLVSNPKDPNNDDDGDDDLALWVIILIMVCVVLFLAVVGMTFLYSWKQGYLGNRIPQEVMEDGQTIVEVCETFCETLEKHL